MIKVIRIYVKSPILETGAVLVDLPGIQDSNAARSNFASRYMQDCTRIFIVSPITRAVDDKSAHDLIERSLKQELKMDGMYYNLTFICSKSDDIRMHETLDAFCDWDEEVLSLQRQYERAESNIRSLEDAIRSKKSKKKEMGDVVRNLEENRKALDQRLLKPVIKLPRQTTIKENRGKKRKSSEWDDQTQNNMVMPHLEQTTLFFSSPGVINSGGPSTEEANYRKELNLLELRKGKKLDQLERVSTQISMLQEKLRDTETDKINIHNLLGSFCMKRRNEYCKEEINRRFAAETKKFNRSIRELENNANITCDVDFDDSDEPEIHLPVFCVSSAAFEDLSRSSRISRKSTYFTNRHDTEVSRAQYSF